MTLEEKKDKVNDYCSRTPCDECVLDYRTPTWCEEHYIGTDDEKALDEAIKLIEPTATETIPSKPVEDIVNKPSHYNHGMECIDEMILIFGIDAVMTFCKLNVWKYRKRALHKNGQEDIDKSNWYINKYQELQERLRNGR